MHDSDHKKQELYYLAAIIVPVLLMIALKYTKAGSSISGIFIEFVLVMIVWGSTTGLYKLKYQPERILLLLFALSAFMLITGEFFRSQHWPYGNILSGVGLVLCSGFWLYTHYNCKQKK